MDSTRNGHGIATAGVRVWHCHKSSSIASPLLRLSPATSHLRTPVKMLRVEATQQQYKIVVATCTSLPKAVENVVALLVSIVRPSFRPDLAILDAQPLAPKELALARTWTV